MIVSCLSANIINLSVSNLSFSSWDKLASGSTSFGFSASYFALSTNTLLKEFGSPSSFGGVYGYGYIVAYLNLLSSIF